ncbi:hypothetical protein TNCV_2386181 [Trichonephila clavipes]|nr:hypothetical protein TNCV_2386181 [Trichonephila clavipes]
MVHSGAPDLSRISNSPIGRRDDRGSLRVTRRTNRRASNSIEFVHALFKFKVRKVLDCRSKIRQGRRDDRGSLRVTRRTNRRASFRLALRNKTGREEMRSEGRRGILPLEDRAAQWVERGGSEKFKNI